MYADFFGLRCRPFEDRPDPQFSFLWPPFEEALAALEYEARYGSGMGLVVGEAGTGKTQLLRTLMSRLRATEHAVLWPCPPGGEAALLPALAKASGVSAASEPSSRMLERMRKHVTRTASGKHQVTLIVDQAEHLTGENLAELESIASLRETAKGGLALLLAAQPRFRSLLGEPRFARLQQWLCGERVLSKLELSETEEYIRHRLKVAGAATPEVFEREAIGLIHAASGGVPRLINRLCDEAMVAAYGAGVKTITRALTLDVAQRHAYRERSADWEAVGGMGDSREATPVEYGGRSAPQGDPPYTERRAASLGHGASAAEDQEMSSEVAEAGMEPAGGQGPLGGHTASEAAALLGRLQSAMARAERFASTSEASLAQYGAVEKHLGALSARAEKLIGDLHAALRSGNESGDRLKERLGGAVDRAEHRLGAVDGRVAEVEGLTGEIEERLRRVDETFARAERLESHLASVAEQLADKAADVQERVNLLFSAVQAGEEIQAGLHAESDAWTERRKELELLRKGHEEAAQEAVKSARAELARLTEHAVSEASRAEQQAGAVSRELQTAVRAGEGLKDELKRELSGAFRTRLEEELAGFRKRMNGELAAAREQLQEQLAQQGQRAEAAFEAQRAKTEKLITSSGREIKQVGESLKKAEERAGRLGSALAEADRDLDALAERSAALEESVGRSSSAVEKLSKRSEASQSALAGSVKRVEELMRETQAVRGQWEALQSGFTASLVDLGLACERAQRTQDAVKQYEHTAGEAIREKDALESLVGRIRQAVDDGCARERTLRSVTAEASEMAAKVQAGNAEAGGMLGKLYEATGNGQEVLEEIRSTAAAAEETAEHAERRCEGLESVTERGSELLSQLGELVPIGRQLHEATQALISHADEKLNQLVQERPVSSELLTQLREANETGRTVLDGAREAVGQTEEVIGRLQEGLEENRVQREQAEAQANELATHIEKAVSAIEGLRGAQEAGSALAARLDELITQTSRTHGELEQGWERAEALVERTAGAEETLGRVEERAGTISQEVAEACAMQSGLRSVVEDAGQYAGSLESLLGAARELIEVQERLGSDAETASTRLAEQLEQAHGLVTGASEALGNFMDRAQSLEEKVVALSERTDALQGYVDEATAKPSELVEAAQAQTAELERVSAAVRKVFANLSRTTLDAHRQGKELDTRGRETSQRLAALTKHTERASQTLEQWVREAVQVQSRLERTLSRCPSIQETHPGDEIRELASATASAASVQGPRVGSGIRMLGGGSGEGKRRSSGAPPRGEEVARLLEEAKQAEPARGA